MMKKSPLLRAIRGTRKSRGHSRQGSAGVEVGSEEGEGKHRRASSWSPTQLEDGEEGRRPLVSDSPVDLFGETSGETDHILKNLGNFPIHGRQAAAVAAQQKTSVPISEELSPARELSQQQPNEPPDIDIVGEESESRLLDTSGAEELSVKTLADMFDFRLGEQPTKPPLSKSKDRLLVAKMSELAKVSSNSNSIRRCQEGNDIEHIVFSDCSEC